MCEAQGSSCAPPPLPLWTKPLCLNVPIKGTGEHNKLPKEESNDVPSFLLSGVLARAQPSWAESVGILHSAFSSLAHLPKERSVGSGYQSMLVLLSIRTVPKVIMIQMFLTDLLPKYTLGAEIN